MTGFLRLPRRLGAVGIFGVLAAVGVWVEHLAVHRVGLGVHPALLGGAVAFDMLVLLPAAFYVLVVRRYGLP